MTADVKYFDGNLARIDRVPTDLRRLYATAFEIEPKCWSSRTARRQKVDRPVAVAQHLHAGRLLARSWTRPTSSRGSAA